MNLISVLYDKIVWYNARSKTIGYANLSVQITSPVDLILITLHGLSSPFN